MMKKLFLYILFLVTTVSCVDESERIVTINIIGGNELDSTCRVEIVRSYDEEDVEIIKLDAKRPEGLVEKNEISVVKGTKLSLLVIPGENHDFMGYTGDINAASLEANTIVNSDTTIDVTFYAKLGIRNEPQNDGTTYTIKHSTELRWLQVNVNGDTTAAPAIPADAFNGKTVELANDIYMGGGSFLGLNDFAGTFDGKGYAIRDISITSAPIVPANPNGGFIRTLAATGVIKNLTITGTLAASGLENVGVFAGDGGGTTMENLTSEVDVSAQHNAGTLNVGGIVGKNATVKKSYNTGKIFSSAGTAVARSGGIIGDIAAGQLIENCYNTGEIISMASGAGSYASGIVANGVVGVTVKYVYNVGRVTGDLGATATGILGSGFNGTVPTDYVYEHLVVPNGINDGISANLSVPFASDTHKLDVHEFSSITPFNQVGFSFSVWKMKGGLSAGSGNNTTVSTRPVLIGVGSEGR